MRGWTNLTIWCRDNINRRYSFGVKANHKLAFLCVESTTYRYIEDLSTPKRWFKANVDDILKAYGGSHPITKEDLFLGTRNYPLRKPTYLPLGRQSLGHLVRPITLYSSVTTTPTVRCVRTGGVYEDRSLRLLKLGTIRSVCFASKWSTLGKIHHNRFGIVDGRRPPLSRRVYDPLLIQLKGFEDVWWPVGFITSGPTSVQT